MESILKNDLVRIGVITLMMACVLVPIAVVMTAVSEHVYGWNVALSALAFLTAPYIWGVLKNSNLRYSVKDYLCYLAILVGLVVVASLLALVVSTVWK